MFDSWLRCAVHGAMTLGWSMAVLIALLLHVVVFFGLLVFVALYCFAWLWEAGAAGAGWVLRALPFAPRAARVTAKEICESSSAVRLQTVAGGVVAVVGLAVFAWVAGRVLSLGLGDIFSAVGVVALAATFFSIAADQPLNKDLAWYTLIAAVLAVVSAYAAPVGEDRLNAEGVVVAIGVIVAGIVLGAFWRHLHEVMEEHAIGRPAASGEGGGLDLADVDSAGPADA